MALVCNLPESSVSAFSFIDCASINISYEVNGLASVSFTVVSTSQTINAADYQTLSFGSNVSARTNGVHTAGEVTFVGYIKNHELGLIPGTRVYEHKLQLVAWGCRT